MCHTGAVIVGVGGEIMVVMRCDQTIVIIIIIIIIIIITIIVLVISTTTHTPHQDKLP